MPHVEGVHHPVEVQHGILDIARRDGCPFRFRKRHQPSGIYLPDQRFLVQLLLVTIEFVVEQVAQHPEDTAGIPMLPAVDNPGSDVYVEAMIHATEFLPIFHLRKYLPNVIDTDIPAFNDQVFLVTR